MRAVKHAFAQADRALEKLITVDSFNACRLRQLTELEQHLMEELNVRKAMKLAMDKELKLEESLRRLAEKIEDPKVREVFLLNAKSTYQHYELIES